MNTLKKLNSSKYILALVLTVIFLLMLYCNFLTPLKGDDFCYLYSCKDDTRIESVWDIFVSMYYHRFTTNGRVIPHFFVQLFLMMPKAIFNVLNAAMFTLYVWLIYSFALHFGHSNGKTGVREREREHNSLLLCIIMGFIWVVTLDFGTVFLWLDGSVNYLWCDVVLLLWMYIMAKDYVHDLKLQPWQEVLFALFSLAVGNYAENSSVAAVFMMMLFIALSFFWKKRKLKRWHISAFCSMMVGFFFLALAPAEFETKIAEPSISNYIDNFIELIVYYLKFWPLIVFYLLAFVHSVRTEQNWDLRLLSLVFLGGSLAAHFVLTFALYPSTSPLVTSLCLLILACAVLFPGFFCSAFKPAVCLAAAVLFCFTAYWGVRGIQDLRLVKYKWDYNDQLIKEELAAGKTDILVPYIIPDTEYSCLYVWGYVREDPTHYNNIELARYYGANSINGFWFYDTEC